MTGTAETEAEEFAKIYKLDVTVVPTNRPLLRVNAPDVVYKTEREKFDAVAKDIIARNEKGQPVLVGTVSIEKSEAVAKLLKKRGVRHEVLNAKYHEREAEIVAQAGRAGAVTIATNMAGRGVDILLGGNPDFLADVELRDRGLDPVETREAYEEAWDAVLEDMKKQVAAEAEEVIRWLATRERDLVRLLPWPESGLDSPDSSAHKAFRSCISVTGDIDALTLFDFAYRLKEFS